MRITSKGQVTIPQEIREHFGLLPNTEVTFDVRNGEVRLRKANGKSTARGDAVIASLSKFPRRTKQSTDEIMTLMRGER
jgi:AbrB family looped-hinge helix DNA binding protein